MSNSSDGDEENSISDINSEISINEGENSQQGNVLFDAYYLNIKYLFNLLNLFLLQLKIIIFRF